MKNVAIIGLGPHARRIYYPYLERRYETKHDVQLKLVVDLDMNKKIIQDYIDSKKLKPEKTVFLGAKSQINPTVIDTKVRRLLQELKITHVILATEPKAHKIYLEECIRQKIPVLTDKPITAPIGLMPDPKFIELQDRFTAAQRVKADVIELIKSIEENPGARVLVQAQRRQHKGYELVRERLRGIVKEYEIPITYLQIHHSDGMWNMPNEILIREGHPYKYGYGKLMHSGYHFLDLMYSFLNINLLLEHKRPDHLSIFNQVLRPFDHYEILNETDYTKLLGKRDIRLPSNTHGDNDYLTYGELDSYSQLQLSRDNKVLTTVQMSLMQSGFSQRAWAELPEDTYKGNGRVRHEFINIHVGPLYSVQVHSYQASEARDDLESEDVVGGKNHFDVYIFKNSNLLGGKPFERIEFGKDHHLKHANGPYYLGQNEEPRYQIVDELLDDLPSNSELSTHLTTNALMSAFYTNHAKQQFGETPFENYKFEDIFYPVPVS
jgi:hypothetical protein